MQRRWINRTVESRIFMSDEWYNLDLNLQDYRKAGQIIVLTCGCFDVLHIGHARLLREAADHGDILAVGLNSDASVKRLKGPTRPIIEQYERMEMVASLEGVSFVTAFEEDDPRLLIQQIRPNIYVKGKDYLSRDLIEEPTVTENGGRIVFVTYTHDHSTTALIRRLMRQED